MLHRRIFVIFLIAALLAGLGWSGSVPLNARAAAVLYVSPGGLTSGFCSNWSEACELSYALPLAYPGMEVWAQAGVYKPTTELDRMATFLMMDGARIYGGFGGTETDLSQRDWRANPTVLSGDIGIAGDINDNSYHVVVAGNVDMNAVLDGFTIRGGNAIGFVSGDPLGLNDGSGGGMFILGGNPTLSNLVFDSNIADYGGGVFDFSYGESSPGLTNVTFLNNSATWGGGGMANDSSHPRLENVTFSQNTAGDLGGGMINFCGGDFVPSNPRLNHVTFDQNIAVNGGGGMYNWSSSPSVINTTFTGNSSDYGGGMYNWGDMYAGISSPNLVSVIFHGNSATAGGGMANEGGSPSLANVVFYQNQASGGPDPEMNYGGGMVNFTNDMGGISDPTLINVTFNANQATHGGALANLPGTHPVIRNSIFWGDGAFYDEEIMNDAESLLISSSLLQYGCPLNATCEQLILSDPLFTNAAEGDLHLSSTSPAIDAGNNSYLPADTLDLDGDGDTVEALPYDLDGNPRFLDHSMPDTGSGTVPIVDLGAYETANSQVNNPPTISAIPDQTTDEDVPTPPAAFTIADIDTPIDSLILSAESSNTALLPVSNITFGGSGENRSISLAPSANQHGQVTVTVYVSDEEASSSTSFMVTVNSVNDPPVLAPIGNQSVKLGSQLRITASASDVDGDPLTYSLDSGAPKGASINPTTGLFTWTPSRTGTYILTVRVRDNGSPVLDDYETITITVTKGKK